MEYLIRVVCWLITALGILLAGFGTKETLRMVRHMKNTFGRKIILLYVGFALLQIRESYIAILLYTTFWGFALYITGNL